MQHVHIGFNLIELMIFVAIIGILAAVAVPAYQNYTLKARFTEMVNATAPYKSAIEICIQSGACNLVAAAVNVPATGARNAAGVGVPDDLGAAGNITSLTVGATGVITVTPAVANGIAAADTYILTPTVAAGRVTWARTGGCSTRAAGPIC